MQDNVSQDSTTLELLTRTGCLVPSHIVDGDVHMKWASGTMDPLADPLAVTALARRVADALPGPKPDLLVTWQGLPNLLLGFAVGVALGTPVVLLSDAEGLVTGSGSVEAGQRVALVGVTLGGREVNMARAFVGNSGGSLDLIASLVDIGENPGELSLVALQDHTFSETDCPACGDGAQADAAVTEA